MRGRYDDDSPFEDDFQEKAKHDQRQREHDIVLERMRRRTAIIVAIITVIGGIIAALLPVAINPSNPDGERVSILSVIALTIYNPGEPEGTPVAVETIVAATLTPLATIEPTQPPPTLTALPSATASPMPPTPIPMPTDTPQPIPPTVGPVACVEALAPGYNLPPVTQNDAWTPLVCDVNGVEMVLVPPGCFMMGTDNGQPNEDPAHEQCFDRPFWIDRFEVTNLQYGSDGSIPGDNLPRIDLTWYQARDHCARRGAQLPTEAEWEYAARGPDGLDYPWGDVFEIDFTISLENASTSTYPVGSRPEGASWVGALDMAGNVWEWTSTLERRYPYDAGDGREDPDNTSLPRVSRGGGFTDIAEAVRTAKRAAYLPEVASFWRGVRCAMPAG